jgi:hypothetical protein
MGTAADYAELERIYADTTGTKSSKDVVGGNNDFLGFVLSQFWFLFLTQKNSSHREPLNSCQCGIRVNPLQFRVICGSTH